MKKKVILLGVFVAVGAMVCALAIAEKEDEQTVSFDQLPAAVQTALTAAAEGGQIKEIELEDGIYEADVLLNGQKVEIKIAADGKVLSKEIDADDDDDEEDEKEDEQTVTFDQLPAAVQTALTAAAEGGQIKEIELEDGIYEADVLLNGQKVEIKIAADGKVLSKEIDADDDEDDDD
jgi:uncharacterized membrane protein YkoI